MSFRAVLLGLIGALLIAGFGYINTQVIKLEPIDSGHLIPISVIGLLILAMVTVNPLLFKLHRPLALRPAEAAVMVMMMFVASSIPGRGLMEQFTTTLAMPAHWNQTSKGWQRHDLLGYVPPAMLPAEGRHDPEVLNGMLTGLGAEGRYIGLGSVPWGKWARPLMVWLPLLVLVAIASISLALIVHRQWSVHERLRYPIAEFAVSLVNRQADRPLGALFRNKMFWIGLSVVLGIRVINGLNVWADGQWISVPMQFDLAAIRSKWPLLPRVPWGWSLTYPTLYPIVVGFSFFLAADISFSLGISQYLIAAVSAVMFVHGVNISSSYMAGGPMGWHRSGAYFAFALVVVYIGRGYYIDVLKSALTFRCRRNVPPYAAWATRAFIAAVIGMTALIIALGLDWPLAILTVGLLMMMLLGVSRIAAETGLFFIQPRWQPMGVLLGLFGSYAFGIEGVIVVGLLCAILCLDPSQAVMPYFINGLRLCDRQGVRPGRTGWLAGGTFVAALAVAVVVVLWANYNYGATRYHWSFRRVPTMAFRPAVLEADRLAYVGRLASSDQLGPLERIRNMRPDRRYLWGAGTGFALVLLVGALRLRFTWWPIHPVLFLVWATYPMVALHHSFLLGWLIRLLVTKLGGYATYRKCRPLMTGLIAGDLLGALVFMVTGSAYYGFTGVLPPAIRVFPR